MNRTAPILALLLLSVGTVTALTPTTAAADATCADGAEPLGAVAVRSMTDQVHDRYLHDGGTATVTYTLVSTGGWASLRVYDAETCQPKACEAGLHVLVLPPGVQACTLLAGDHALEVTGTGPYAGQPVDYTLTATGP